MSLPDELIEFIFNLLDISFLFRSIRPANRRFYNLSRTAAIRGLLKEDCDDSPIHIHVALVSDIDEDTDATEIIEAFGQPVTSNPIETWGSYLATGGRWYEDDFPDAPSSEKLVYFDGAGGVGNLSTIVKKDLRCHISIRSDVGELTRDDICLLSVPAGDDGSLGLETVYDVWCGDFFYLKWGLQHGHGEDLTEGHFMVSVDSVGVQAQELLPYRLEADRQVEEAARRRLQWSLRVAESEKRRLARSCTVCKKNMKALQCVGGRCGLCCRKQDSTCRVHF